MNDIEARRVIAYTDGACINNPGPGGYAAIMVRESERRIVKGREAATTNQRMELTAALKAIESMKTDAPLTIVSDSQYVVKGATEWLAGWKAKGWKTASKKPISNRDLWENLDVALAARPNGVLFEWTKGHAGTLLNEEADRLAEAEARAQKARLTN